MIYENARTLDRMHVVVRAEVWTGDKVDPALFDFLLTAKEVYAEEQIIILQAI